MRLAGQAEGVFGAHADDRHRILGAQLLLSEVLEYVVHGLGVVPYVDGIAIEKPNDLNYQVRQQPDLKEMVDGLADVAYTMFWNQVAFGVPLDQAFDLVADNNLEKFVRLENWAGQEGALPREAWHVGRDIVWPDEVHTVSIIKLSEGYFAVGKDANGKVRKPSSYRSVDLSGLLPAAIELND